MLSASNDPAESMTWLLFDFVAEHIKIMKKAKGLNLGSRHVPYVSVRLGKQGCVELTWHARAWVCFKFWIFPAGDGINWPIKPFSDKLSDKPA